MHFCRHKPEFVIAGETGKLLSLPLAKEHSVF